MKYLCIMLSWAILVAYFIIGHAMLSWLLPYVSDLPIYFLLSLLPAFFLCLYIWFVIDDRKYDLKNNERGVVVVGPEQKGSEFQQETTQKHSINVKC